MSQHQEHNIKVQSEQLESLKIIEEASERTIEYMNKMSTVLVLVNQNNEQAELLKNMVLDLGWFDGDRMKFEDWWREMRLFLKSNQVMETDNRITVILTHLREGVARIYAQKKLDELDKETGIQDWNEFIWEIKTTFSDKSKAANAKWKIETFKQGKKNIADFMIEFKVLAMKANTDKLHAIFLLKKNVTNLIL